MNTTFNQQQRKEFDRALHDIRQRAARSLYEKQAEAGKLAIQELLQTFDGAEALANTVIRLKSELDAAEEKLEAFGFEINRDGDILVSYRAPENVREVYDSRVKQHLTEESAKVEAIDAAIRNAWTISSLPEAMKIVKQFA